MTLIYAYTPYFLDINGDEMVEKINTQPIMLLTHMEKL
jgi:hypothetical protein